MATEIINFGPGSVSRGLSGDGATITNQGGNIIRANGTTVTPGTTISIPVGQSVVLLESSFGGAIVALTDSLDPAAIPSVVVSQGPPVPLISQFSNTTSGDVEYVGKAVPGSTTSSAVWQIKKFIYVNGNLSQILTAAGGAFNQVWDNRAALTYA